MLKIIRDYVFTRNIKILRIAIAIAKMVDMFQIYILQKTLMVIILNI